MWNDTSTLENSLFLKKLKLNTYYMTNHRFKGKGNKCPHKDLYIMFTAALFVSQNNPKVQQEVSG